MQDGRGKQKGLVALCNYERLKRQTSASGSRSFIWDWEGSDLQADMQPLLYDDSGSFRLTTVRVLKCETERMSNDCSALVGVQGGERLEVFTRFSPSMFFAKLSGCMPENLFLPNSPT